ncbi:LysR family transcriptional regulator [Variovorax sp. VRV01]|uniref:LysR family transcriptional regulator n=1 Tax=Variovorax sp. VRV01 TaxID=2769259 RepID=UPI0017810234|nr:LysR family transcriptional regulator [Variovorax sp. VRV01]MBD9666752.1 LysR family transcriptional regulator [Variovorax sp. VRV01]
MELKQWRCFVTLAEIGNIRRAASLLAISQPALSVRVQRLEEALGFALFDRQARGVRLTEQGARLLPHARRLLSRAAETDEAARAIGRGAFDRLEIGVTPIAALSFFPDAMRAFSATHPGVVLALTEGLSDELEEAVAHRRLDLAVVHPPSSRDDLVVREVARDRFMAVVPAAHPLAGAGCIAAADLRQQTLVGVRRDIGPVVFDRIAAYLARAGITTQVNQCASSSISLVGLVAAGAGIGLVVESLACIARPDIRFVALADDPPSLGYAMCHRSDLPAELQGAFMQAFHAPKAGAGVRPES